MQKNKSVLVTGATGNIGFEVLRYLLKEQAQQKVFAAVRNIEKARSKFQEFESLNYRTFDFENQSTFSSAFESIDTLFLLRPPHIADIKKHFRPLLSAVKASSIKHILFLSVQGAERSKVIPHHKIEALIVEFDIEYIFLRPSYFMQNLTTTLYQNIKEKRQIVLPSGNAFFNWIDVKNIGEVAAILLNNFEDYKNKAIELTGYENANFYYVADTINTIAENKVEYKSVNPVRFYRIKKSQGMVKGMIIVMIILHFLPRLQKLPKFSTFYEELTGKKPTSLSEFIEREKNKF